MSPGTSQAYRNWSEWDSDWEAMESIEGSAKKGIKALDKLKVVWPYARQDGGHPLGKVITQPAEGEPVLEPKAADWKGGALSASSEPCPKSQYLEPFPDARGVEKCGRYTSCPKLG
jgi:protein-tyrosine phosphatase